MKLITGFFMAWGNFCAIPCPYKKWDEKARNHMLIMFPAVGLLIGVLWYILYLLLDLAQISGPLAAAALTAYPFIVCGFMHLDGFMDCNDAILSRRPLQERQRILKDSHVGAFAVIAVVLLFMMFFAAMWSILEKGSSFSGWCLIAIPVMARAMSARSIMVYTPLTTSQYQGSFNKTKNAPYKWVLTMIWLLAAILLLAAGSFFGGFSKDFLISAVVMIVAELAASLMSGAHARKQLGGMSGDIAGFMLVWSELIAVISLAVI